MPLSNESWRSQLDDHLDAYVRRYIAQDSMDYSMTEMVMIFREHLNLVPESASVLLDQSSPLEAFMQRSNVQEILSSAGSGLLTEKWQTSRAVMDYLKCVVNLNSLKTDRSERTSQLWNIEEPPTPTRLVQPLLSRAAKRETPLRGESSTQVYPNKGHNHKLRSQKSQLPCILTIPNASSWNTLATEEEDPLSDADHEALTEPRLRIPREETFSVLSLVKSTPFSAAIPKKEVTRSTRIILFQDEEEENLTECILPLTPPLFPRQAQSVSKIQRMYNPLASGIASLFSPVTTQENLGMSTQAETMKAIEGPGLSLSTPTLVLEASTGDTSNFASEVDEGFPNSPRNGTNFLAELFDSRIEDVLVSRVEQLPHLRTRATSSHYPRDQSFLATLAGIFEDRMDAPLPSSPRFPVGPPEEKMSKDVYSDMSQSLDCLSGRITNMDVYSLISGEKLENEDNSMLLPVPNLMPVHDLTREGRWAPFVLADLSSLPFDASLNPARCSITPSCFLETTGSVVSLALSLSWQPFHYKGTFFSDETVCMVDQLATDVETRLYLNGHTPLSDGPIPDIWPDYILDGDVAPREWSGDRVLLSRRELHSQKPSYGPGDASIKVAKGIPESSSTIHVTFSAAPPPPTRHAPSSSSIKSGRHLGCTIEAERGSSHGAHSDGSAPLRPSALGDGRVENIFTSESPPTPSKEPLQLEQKETISPPLAWSNRTSLFQYLAQRGIKNQAEKISLHDEEPERDDAFSHGHPHNLHPLEDEAPADEISLPSSFLSKKITLPNVWTTPSDLHRYLCSISTVQRRGLAQSLGTACKVTLYELSGMLHPDVVIDSHSAVLFRTLSDIPSTLDTLASGISQLAYGFSRILVVLESFPADRAHFSAERWKTGHWTQLNMLTKTTSEACIKLKNKVNVKLGLLGDDEDFEATEAMNGGQTVSDASVEFVLSRTIEESAQFVRIFGDYSAGLVTPLERAEVGGARLWLDRVQEEDVSCLLGQYRGMNVFAALAISSVTPLSNFVAMSSQEKLHSFGTLLGSERMLLFDKTYRRTASGV